MFAKTPKPPYYAVIFTSHQAHDEGYAETSARMEELGREQPGFLGIESVRGDDGLGDVVNARERLDAAQRRQLLAVDLLGQRRPRRAALRERRLHGADAEERDVAEDQRPDEGRQLAAAGHAAAGDRAAVRGLREERGQGLAADGVDAAAPALRFERRRLLRQLLARNDRRRAEAAQVRLELGTSRRCGDVEAALREEH